ncbi:SigE family RNA polymerase sigma factor [Actinocorallia lasiicapitis]
MDEEHLSFTAFVRGSGTRLLRFAVALCGDREQAEDALQSVLERVYPRWQKIVAHGDPEWYVKRGVVNELKDGWRRRKRRPEELGIDAELDGGTYTPFDAFVTRDAVRRAMTGLPTGQRTVIVLRYWEGLSEAETARLMGVSVGTVKSQGHRAMRTLRSTLRLEEDIEPAGAHR